MEWHVCRCMATPNGEQRTITHSLVFGEFYYEESSQRSLSLGPNPGAHVSSSTPDPGIGNNDATVNLEDLTCFDEDDLKTTSSALELESRLFLGTGADDVLGSFARDDFAVVRLAWFF